MAKITFLRSNESLTTYKTTTRTYITGEKARKAKNPVVGRNRMTLTRPQLFKYYRETAIRNREWRKGHPIYIYAYIEYKRENCKGVLTTWHLHNHSRRDCCHSYREEPPLSFLTMAYLLLGSCKSVLKHGSKEYITFFESVKYAEICLKVYWKRWRLVCVFVVKKLKRENKIGVILNEW